MRAGQSGLWGGGLIMPERPTMLFRWKVVSCIISWPEDWVQPYAPSVNLAHIMETPVNTMDTRWASLVCRTPCYYHTPTLGGSHVLTPWEVATGAFHVEVSALCPLYFFPSLTLSWTTTVRITALCGFCEAFQRMIENESGLGTPQFVC